MSDQTDDGVMRGDCEVSALVASSRKISERWNIQEHEAAGAPARKFSTCSVGHIALSVRALQRDPKRRFCTSRFKQHRTGPTVPSDLCLQTKVRDAEVPCLVHPGFGRAK